MTTNSAESPAVLAVKTPTVPRLLYHYTNAAGLQGIVDSGQLWMTDSHYVNDSREVIEGCELFANLVDQVVEQYRVKFPNFAHLEMMRTAVLAAITSEENAYTSLACFSELGDSLTLWRAYGDDGLGFAIGIDHADLVDGQDGYAIARVAYLSANNKEVPQVATDLAQQLEKFFDGQRLGSEQTMIQARQALAQHVRRVKNSAFQDEREWRVFATMNDPPQKFTARGGLLVPRKWIRLMRGKHECSQGGSTEAPRISIREIVVGPRPDRALAEKSVRAFVDSHIDLRGKVEIKRSRLPYRPNP